MHRGMPSQFKNPFQKNHALAESLLSHVFSWDVVDVGFPTCSSYPGAENMDRGAKCSVTDFFDDDAAANLVETIFRQGCVILKLNYSDIFSLSKNFFLYMCVSKTI
jgi:hypothetical protein